MDYKKEYQTLHSKNKFKGYSVREFKDVIRNLVAKTNSKTILDYGSGMGFQYSKDQLDTYWNVSVTCYDPYYQPFSNLPFQTFDGVVCTEVMEHVPESEVQQTLSTIFSKATRFVFFSISTRKSTKIFSNGQDIHVTVKSESWWYNQIEQANVNDIDYYVEFTN